MDEDPSSWTSVVLRKPGIVGLLLPTVFFVGFDDAWCSPKRRVARLFLAGPLVVYLRPSTQLRKVRYRHSRVDYFAREALGLFAAGARRTTASVVA